MTEHKIMRLVAHLLQEGVDPAAIERGVLSAQHMKPGESATLNLGAMERVFCTEQARRLLA